MSLLYAEGIEAAADTKDRAWFRNHPRRNTYVRGFVPGELPVSMPTGDGVAVTVVRQMGKGARMRLPLYIERMPGDTEREAVQLFRRAMGKDA